MLGLLAVLCCGALPAIASDALDFLPENIDGAVVVASPEKMLELFGLTELRAEHPEKMAEAREEMLQAISLDLLDVAAMKKAGIRTGQPLVIAWLDAPVACGVLVIAGNQSTLEHIRGSDEGSRLFAREESYAGTSIALTEDGRAACFLARDHIVFVGRSEDGDGDLLESVRRLLDGKEPRLIRSQRFRDLQKAVKGDADVTVYVGSAAYQGMARSKFPLPMAKHGMTDEKSAELYKALGLDDVVALYKARFGPEQVVVDGYALHGGESVMLGWVRPDNDPVPFMERLATAPWLANVQRINGAAAWSTLRGILETARPDSLPPIDESFSKVREETGIDVENDVINQIDGNLGFVVDSAGMMQVDATIFLQVRDTKKLEATLATVTNKINEKMAESKTPQGMGSPNSIEKTRERGATFYRMTMAPMGELCYGEVGGHLLVTASTDRYLAIAKGGDGLVSALGNDVAAGALRDRTGSLFYLNFDGLARDLAGWAPMIGRKAESAVGLFSNLKSLSGSATVEKGGMRHQIQLTGAQPGMWKQLAAFFVESAPSHPGDSETH